jgi:signal peptidase I
METIADRRKKTQRMGGERRAGDVVRIAESLESRGRVSLCVHGASMMPWVRPGDIAMIRTAKAETLRCGHVVLFRRSNSLFVHRIVNKKGPQEAAQIFVKGDAHPTSDGLMEQGELLGRVVWLYRKGRRIDLEAVYFTVVVVRLVLVSRSQVCSQCHASCAAGHPGAAPFERSRPLTS